MQQDQGGVTFMNMGSSDAFGSEMSAQQVTSSQKVHILPLSIRFGSFI
ncbi:uncharacterized protein [Blastocystis hominis]|uniref:Uncharacterized protein n=1 Tax=Blastocystis hominis TaxID=12968 RepID=D8M108_BLAHO|nr:uncharacterized protein [Blastocystis hominis]CBK21747.2 unnamed protein product [Blastocystis hominis]|eukprot:XP_012895795.1 uncharacterized protein [Blastocystis hominis]